MHFQHANEIWRDFPELVPGVIRADGITEDAPVDRTLATYHALAESRLALGTEGELPEIQAWRRAFSVMGHRPTQYRCASESLLRRFRKENSLPRIHPLIDVCNAVSLAFAIPVGVFDVSEISGNLEVRYATGDEKYVTFSGGTENPGPGEVIFADDAGQAHSRRWTNRQSGASAVRGATSSVLIIAEAMHESAPADMHRLTAALAEELSALWSVNPASCAVMSQDSPRFPF
ncbi:B3/B4 domain-containing protein [Streptomyces sp. NPDC055287]